MSVTITAFFNNKGGVGKTSLVFHLAWMYAHLGIRILAADLDPQANLTAGFFDDEKLEELWPDGEHPLTVYGALRPLIELDGPLAEPHVEEIDYNLALLPGDMLLSGFEDELSEDWPKALDGRIASFKILSAFRYLIQQAADTFGADLALIDVGPNLGAINRAAMIAADYIVVPLAPDLFSLQGLRNLGPTLVKWKEGWKDRLKRAPNGTGKLPDGRMQPLGYVVLQHSERLDRPVKAYKKWIERIPESYRDYVSKEPMTPDLKLTADPNCIALLKHYRSLVPMGREARKPIFDLRAADGALGGHIRAVQDAYRAYEKLALNIAERISLDVPRFGQMDLFRDDEKPYIVP